MDFANLDYLYLLLLVPVSALFLVWTARQRRASMARLGTPSSIAALADSVGHRLRRWKTTLWYLSLVALLLALARPRWGTQVTARMLQGVEVMVTLDVSASMLAEDIKPNRLARAKLTIEELLDRLGGNDVGLVIFSGAAFVQFPLTADLNTARTFLDAAGPGTISRPGTALADAIRVAQEGFSEDRPTSQVILLLTDGEGHEGDAFLAAQDAAERGVIIHAIGFGSPTGEPVPIRSADGTLIGYKKTTEGEMVLSRLDEVTLQQITAETGGLYFRTSPGGEETDSIVQAILALETAEREGQFDTHRVERFPWFGGAAFLSLAVATLLSDRKRHA